TAYRADALDDLLRQWRSEFMARESELEELSRWLLAALR
ncbi:lipoate--protein ligase, partial [Aeromonas hydrophila]